MTIKEDNRLNNTERNINEELLIDTKKKSGKLTEKQWDAQQKRNEQSKRLEEIENKLKELNQNR